MTTSGMSIPQPPKPPSTQPSVHAVEHTATTCTAGDDGGGGNGHIGDDVNQRPAAGWTRGHRKLIHVTDHCCNHVTPSTSCPLSTNQVTLGGERRRPYRHNADIPFLLQVTTDGVA